MKPKVLASIVVLIFLIAAPALRAVDKTFTSSGQILPGEQWDNVYVYNDATIVDMLGGILDSIGTHDASTLNVFDGTVSTVTALEASRANVSGGYVHTLWAWDSATATLSGTGEVVSLSARGHSGIANMYGGSAVAVDALQSGAVNIHGGFVSDYISAPDGTINIFGYDLFKTEIGGAYGYGFVTGHWQSGTPFAIDLLSPETYSHVNLVPEPSTILLLATGAVVCKVTFNRTGNHTPA
jgi:hypothetical protein